MPDTRKDTARRINDRLSQPNPNDPLHGDGDYEDPDKRRAREKREQDERRRRRDRGEYEDE